MKALQTFSPRAIRSTAAAMFLLFCLIADGGRGATYYWDPNKNGTPSGGTWDTTSSQWSLNSTGGSDTTWGGYLDVTVFCAGPSSTASQGSFTITVNSTVGCNGIYTGLYNPGPAVITFSGSGGINFESGVVSGLIPHYATG